MRTMGVEEEFFVYDAVADRLVPVGAAAAEDQDEASDGQFEHELKREQAELGSAVHDDVAELEAELRSRRSELARSVASRGGRLVASGTAVLPSPVQGGTTTDDDRYHRMADIFGETARAALSCGMHVHVSVESRDEGIRVVDAIRPWLPALLALSANSPFADGRDTGYQSFRSLVWQEWPTAGPTGPFGDVDGYDRLREVLVESGAALDDGMLYFDARLSASYPTVEIRAADVCPRATHAAALAGLCRALVDAAASGALPAVDPLAGRLEVLRAARWRAARHAMTERLLDPRRLVLGPAWDLVDALVDAIAPERAVRDGLQRIRVEGTGSEVQRSVAAGGRLSDVVDALAALTVDRDDVRAE